MVQTVAIVGGLIFAGVGLRQSSRVTRMSGMLGSVQNHREIWQTVIDQPQLYRVFETNPNPAEPTVEERVLLTLLIIHISTSYYTSQLGGPPIAPNVWADISFVLTKPIPRRVWEEVRIFQDKKFVDAVENALARSIS
jgi:hypothetical protein